MVRYLSCGKKDYIIKHIHPMLRKNSTKIENVQLKVPCTKITAFGSEKLTQLAWFIRRLGVIIQYIVIYAMAACTMNAWAKTSTKTTRTLIASKKDMHMLQLHG